MRLEAFRPFRRIYRLVSFLLYPPAASLASCTSRRPIFCALQVFVWRIDSSQENSIWSPPAPLKFSYKLYKSRDIVCRELTHFSDSWYSFKKNLQSTSRQTQGAEGQMQHIGTLDPDKNYNISASQIDISKLFLHQLSADF